MGRAMLSRAAPRVRVANGALQRSGAGERKAPNGDVYDHRFLASTERLASDRGVILADAWRVGQWMKRPRFIANHDIGGFAKLTDVALGRGVWAGVESGLPEEQAGPTGRGLVVYVRYSRTPFAQEVRMLYEDGGLDDVSVRWDWRTEQLRDPTDEERKAHGDELAWVATRADLVEVSAVMLGADPGAQLVRAGVEQAVARCRGKGLCLPNVERFLRNPGALDVMGATDALDALRATLAGLEGWQEAVGPIRQQLADNLTVLANLVMAASDDDEPDEALAERLAALNAAVSSFDLAQRDMAPAITAISDAVQGFADAIGVDLTVTGRAEREERLSFDWSALLADER